MSTHICIYFYHFVHRFLPKLINMRKAIEQKCFSFSLLFPLYSTQLWVYYVISLHLCRIYDHFSYSSIYFFLLKIGHIISMHTRPLGLVMWHALANGTKVNITWGLKMHIYWVYPLLPLESLLPPCKKTRFIFQRMRLCVEKPQ